MKERRKNEFIKMFKKLEELNIKKKIILFILLVCIFVSLFILCKQAATQVVVHKNKWTGEVYCKDYYVLGELKNSTCEKEEKRNWKEEFLTSLNLSESMQNQS